MNIGLPYLYPESDNIDLFYFDNIEDYYEEVDESSISSYTSEIS